mmetsp:Transcript_68897/g.135288  ORF Transcript_68897/g.135288 Transcript_68897/m.135288 type:complete len:180 (-) Transcript_68897:212-751(-)
MPALEIPKEYGLVMVAAGAIGLSQTFIGASVMTERKKAFASPEFAAKPAVKDMNEAHKKAFDQELSKLGYPDMGCGRYSDQLDYAQWVALNNAQRGHYNMVESSGPVLACMLAAGLRYPKPCGALGLVYAAGRWIFALGYRSKKGTHGRMPGALTSAIGMFGMYLSALVAGVNTLRLTA